MKKIIFFIIKAFIYILGIWVLIGAGSVTWRGIKDKWSEWYKSVHWLYTEGKV